MHFKKFLPIENYTLTTKLSVDEVRVLIENNTGPKESFGLFTSNNNSSRPYEGSITGNSFTISRIINYSNSFLPIITGTISRFIDKTEIKIKMRLQKFVTVFISVFMGALGIAFLVQLVYFVSNWPGKSYFLLLNIFISFIFCSLLTYFAFKKESKISKQFLAHLLEGEEIIPQ